MFPIIQPTLRDVLCAILFTSIFVALIIFTLGVIGASAEREALVLRQQRQAAIDLYMRECKDGVAACAVAYDMSPTLRQIYLDKANK